jgi:hypothetical protein
LSSSLLLRLDLYRLEFIIGPTICAPTPAIVNLDPERLDPDRRLRDFLYRLTVLDFDPDLRLRDFLYRLTVLDFDPDLRLRDFRALVRPTEVRVLLRHLLPEEFRRTHLVDFLELDRDPLVRLTVFDGILLNIKKYLIKKKNIFSKIHF